MRKVLQRALIKVVRPYIRAEKAGWGRIYVWMIGCYERDAFWSDAPTISSRNKFFGFEIEYDLRHWADRSAFFLGRWNDLESQLLLCALRPNTVVDIGANRGEFSLAASSLNPSANIIAFEPNPNIASILKRDLERNSITNIELRECGLSDEEAVLTLHVPYVNSGSASFGGFQSDGYEISRIPVHTGDEELNGIEPDFIKIDVEGYELRVLRGLRQTIERTRPIIEIEVLDENLARCQTSRRDIENFMSDLGYRGFGMELQKIGRERELRLVDEAAGCDMIWLPDTVPPGSIHASTKDLRKFSPEAG